MGGSLVRHGLNDAGIACDCPRPSEEMLAANCPCLRSAAARVLFALVGGQKACASLLRPSAIRHHARARHQRQTALKSSWLGRSALNRAARVRALVEEDFGRWPADCGRFAALRKGLLRILVVSVLGLDVLEKGPGAQNSAKPDCVACPDVVLSVQGVWCILSGRHSMGDEWHILPNTDWKNQLLCDAITKDC